MVDMFHQKSYNVLIGRFQHFSFQARLGWLGGLSHVRTVMFCLYRYPHDFMMEILKKEDIHVTVSFVVFTIVYGTISSILGTYIVRVLDKRCKNDRHSSNSDR